jgi:hypothetical protein
VTTQVRLRKQQAAGLIRQEAKRLRSGLWLIASSGVARHWRERQLPSFLRATRPNAMAGRRGIRAALVRWWYVLQPPFLSYIGSESGQYSILLTGKGGPLLMDPGAGVVLRRGDADTASADVARTRQALSQFIGVPAFEPVDGGVRETLIQGRHLSQLSLAERTEVWNAVARGYASLARQYGRDNALPLLQDVFRRLQELRLADDLGGAIRRFGEEALRWAEGQPLVPSHGDLSDDNLIVGPDGAPCLIDFEARCVGYLPCLHDPVILAVREAKRGRPDMLKHLMNGTVELNLPGVVEGHRRQALLLAAIVLHTFRRNQSQGQPDRERWQSHLEAMWRPVARYYT